MRAQLEIVSHCPQTGSAFSAMCLSVSYTPGNFLNMNCSLSCIYFFCDLQALRVSCPVFSNPAVCQALGQSSALGRGTEVLV